MTQLPLKNRSQRKNPMDHHLKYQTIPQPKLRMTKVNKVKMTNNRLLKLKSLAPLPLMIRVKIIKIIKHKPNSRMIKMTNS